MSIAAPSNPSPPVAGRRATDSSALKFKEEQLKSVNVQRHPVTDSDSEIEIIDMGAALPPGSGDDFAGGSGANEPPRVPLTTEQRKHRLELAAFKKSFIDFALTEDLSRIDMSDVKRGDVIRIKTIVGSMYIQILDRLQRSRTGAGTILCACHYDLGDQCTLAHLASVDLPICARNHTFTHADGSQRPASRQLKMHCETDLPLHLSKVLDERFFTELEIYANPVPEKFRLIDLWRILARVFGKIKTMIEENNRREREKKQRKEEARRQ